MRLLVGADVQRLGGLARQLLVGDLRLGLALLHELDGEREAEHERDQRVAAHLASLRAHLLAGVALPDGGVLGLLVGDAQKGVAVARVLRALGDATVHLGLRGLVLLERADLRERRCG